MQVCLNNLSKWAWVAVLSIFFLILNALINNYFLYIIFLVLPYISVAEKLCNNWHKLLKYSNDPLLHLPLNSDINNTLKKKKKGIHFGNNNNKMEFTTNIPVVSVVSEQISFSCRVKYSEYDFKSELKSKEELFIFLFTL